MKGQFFILVDSLGAMMSEMDFKRLEDESDSADMGTLAKSMKAFIKMMTNMSACTKTTIVCTITSLIILVRCSPHLKRI